MVQPRPTTVAIVETRLHAMLLAAGVDRPYATYVTVEPDDRVRVRILIGRCFLLALVEPQDPVKPQLARLIQRLGAATEAAAP